MMSAEVNYAQIEKEMLAMSYSCDKFHHYIYGKQVEVATDYRPLEAIMKKPIAKAPPRLQRMMLKLQRYTFNVSYVPGKIYSYLTHCHEHVAMKSHHVLIRRQQKIWR